MIWNKDGFVHKSVEVTPIFERTPKTCFNGPDRCSLNFHTFEPGSRREIGCNRELFLREFLMKLISKARTH